MSHANILKDIWYNAKRTVSVLTAHPFSHLEEDLEVQCKKHCEELKQSSERWREYACPGPMGRQLATCEEVLARLF